MENPLKTFIVFCKNKDVEKYLVREGAQRPVWTWKHGFMGNMALIIQLVRAGLKVSSSRLFALILPGCSR